MLSAPQGGVGGVEAQCGSQVQADLFFVGPRERAWHGWGGTEAQAKATLLSYALPPAPSRPLPWHLRRWGGCWGGIIEVLSAMEVTCTEAEVCEYLLLAAFLPHPPKRLSKGCA